MQLMAFDARALLDFDAHGALGGGRLRAERMKSGKIVDGIGDGGARRERPHVRLGSARQKREEDEKRRGYRDSIPARYVRK
ncbi:MAG TPA: hypothetical protein VJZ76_16405 [Thermoanaerobaculia bacterium]|nr:hypothetical protein [Thermoanaerobaculia bacterium]